MQFMSYFIIIQYKIMFFSLIQQKYEHVFFLERKNEKK